MNKILTLFLLACALSGAACSRSEKAPEVTVAPTPPPNLPADAKRLHQAQQKSRRPRASACQLPHAVSALASLKDHLDASSDTASAQDNVR